MKNLIFFTAVLFLGIFVTSCSKDDEATSKKDLLTGKTWIVKSKPIVPSVSMNGMTISDISILDPEEVRKYTYKYNEDGTMTQYDETNKVKFTTQWSFNADETQITHNPGIIFTYPIVGNISLSTATIVSISADQMNASIPSTYDGTNYVVTINFVAK